MIDSLAALLAPVTPERFLAEHLDSQAIPPEQFCTRATSRDGAPVLQPDAKLVQGWIARGASVVMNDVDSLTPGARPVRRGAEWVVKAAQGGVVVSPSEDEAAGLLASAA